MGDGSGVLEVYKIENKLQYDDMYLRDDENSPPLEGWQKFKEFK